ncbi:MAG: DUF4406 domain-containing protein [Cetobacterium sp.]
MKVFISQPMCGLTEREIFNTMMEAIFDCREIYKYTDGITILESYFRETEENKDIKNEPLYLLGKSITLMAEADVVYFCKGWEKARGCKLEHACALAYGIDIIEDYKKEKTK